MAIENISIDIKSNIRQIESDVKRLDGDLVRLEKRKPALQINANQLANAKKEIADIDVELKRLNAQKKEIKVNSESVKEAKPLIAEVNKQMDALRLKKANLQVETQQLKGADTKLNKVNRGIDSINRKKANLNIQRDELENSTTGANKLTGILAKINTTRTNINISSNISQIGGQLDKIGTKMLALVNPFNSRLGKMIGFGAVFNLVDRGIRQVTQSMGGAVDRLDALNQFPRVMENLGISTELSAKSAEKLEENLRGLPTTLNDAFSSVTRFTSVNNDIEKSTEQFLAVNNAIIAGTNDVRLQSSALEQLSQAYAKGKPDMMEWRSMMQAMPAQLDQVARAMGMTTDSLGEGLRNGEISMDAFMDKIVELNKVGVDGFASFEKQALASVDGIRVGMTNASTAIIRGNTKILDSLNEVLSDTSFAGVGGIFLGMGEMVEKALTGIAGLIDKNRPKIVVFIETVQERASRLMDKLREFDWSSFGQGLKEGFAGLRDSIKSALDTASPIIDFLKDKITELGEGNFAKGLGKLPALFLKVAVGSKLLGSALKLLGGLTNIKLPSFAGGANGESGNKGLMFNFDAGSALNQAKNMGLIWASVKVIQELAQALQDIDEKVPSNFIRLLPKFANMAIALTGMGVFVAVVGKLAEKNPVAAIAGLAGVALLSLNIMLAAEAMKQIDEKVPSNFLSFAKKLLNMGTAIVGMGVIVAAVGALMATGAGALIAGAGLLTVAALAGEMILVSIAIEQLDKRVPSDLTSVISKIENISIVIAEITKMNLVHAFGLFSNMVGALNTAAVSATLGKFINISNSLRRLEKVNFDEKKAVKSIQDIQKVISAISNRAGLVASAISALDKAVDAVGFALIDRILNKFLDIGGKFKVLQVLRIDTKKVTESIDGIEKTIESIDNKAGVIASAISVLDKSVDLIGFELLDRIIRKFIDIGEAFRRLRFIKIDKKESMRMIDDIEEVIRSIDNKAGLLGSIIITLDKSVDLVDFALLNEIIDRFESMARTFRRLQFITIDKEEVMTSISGIEEIIRSIDNKAFLIGSALSVLDKGIDYVDFTLLGGIIDRFINIANMFDKLQEINVNPVVVARRVGIIETAIKKINNKTGALEAAIEILGNSIKSVNLELLSGIIENFLHIGTAFVGLGRTNFNVEKVTGTIENIETALSAIDVNITKGLDEMDLDPVTELVISFITMAKMFESLQRINIDNVPDVVEHVKEIIDKIKAFSTSDNINSIQELVTAFTNLPPALRMLEGQFTPIGMGYGEQVISGFKATNVPGEIERVINKLIRTLEGKKGEFAAIGKKYGDMLKNAFSKAVEGMDGAIDTQITALTVKSGSFATIGTLYGSSLVTSFRTALSGLSDSIATQVSGMQRTLNSLSMPNLQASIDASGGARYLSSGGLASIFKPRGTDTIPAMLTPGEFVLSRKAVQAIGVGNLQKLNNLDIIGAAKNIYRNFGVNRESLSPVTSIVNHVTNVNNTNNARLTQNMHGNQAHSEQRANRYIKRL